MKISYIQVAVIGLLVERKHFAELLQRNVFHFARTNKPLPFTRAVGSLMLSRTGFIGKDTMHSSAKREVLAPPTRPH